MITSAATNKFIARAETLHNNKFDYSKVNYVKAILKVIIICKIHGEFEQSPNAHLSGKGCKKCANAKSSLFLSSTTSKFVAKATRIHDGKYDYTKVKYINLHEKIIIICKIHGEFEQLPFIHLTGKGCKCCGRERHSAIMTSNTDEFIANSKIVHSNTYDYSTVKYVKYNIKITIICRTHGLFEQLPAIHLAGGGCIKCGKEKSALSLTSNTTDFITKSEALHNNKYTYTKVEYTHSRKKVVITCRIHGDFEQIARHHLDGAGCTECGIITKKNSMTLTTDEFISRSNIVHNNKYDYTKVIYTGALNHVVIICEKHGEFLQTPTTHTNVASGCPRCSTRGYSKQQIAWLKFMSLYYNIDIQHAENGGEYKVENIKADGFCRETGEIYEYHGDFWHGNPARYNPQSMNVMVKKTFGELYQKTIEREQRIIDLGFKLVTIWETEWLNLNKFVKILQMRFRRSRDTRQT